MKTGIIALSMVATSLISLANATFGSEPASTQSFETKAVEPADVFPKG